MDLAGIWNRILSFIISLFLQVLDLEDHLVPQVLLDLKAPLEPQEAWCRTLRMQTNSQSVLNCRNI